MHDLTPLPALGRVPAERLLCDGLRIVDNSDLALASVAARLGEEQACHTRLRAYLGSEPPGPGASFIGPLLSSFWIGPEQWMITRPLFQREDIVSDVTSALGETASVTEQTGGWVCFDVAGPKTIDLLERLCPVPVRRMKSGAVQRTSIDHLGCFVWCFETGSHMRIFGLRSSAASLDHLICAVARGLS